MNNLHYFNGFLNGLLGTICIKVFAGPVSLVICNPSRHGYVHRIACSATLFALWLCWDLVCGWRWTGAAVQDMRTNQSRWYRQLVVLPTMDKLLCCLEQSEWDTKTGAGWAGSSSFDVLVFLSKSQLGMRPPPQILLPPAFLCWAAPKVALPLSSPWPGPSHACCTCIACEPWTEEL
jgi:hypothetical protein